MGEYFNGVKLGTCEHLMYVRKDEVQKAVNGDYGYSWTKANESAGNLIYLEEYLTLSSKWIYRFPNPAEDGQSILKANDRDGEDCLCFPTGRDFLAEVPHKDFLQVSSGRYSKHLTTTFNLPFCPMSQQAKELGVKICNGANGIMLVGERYTPENPDGYTLFACPVCGEWFAMDAEDIAKMIEPLQKSLESAKKMHRDDGTKGYCEYWLKIAKRIKAKKL